MELFDSLRFKIVRRGIKIVFPEATDARILGAAARLKAEELVEPILVGNEEEIRNAAHARGIKTSSFTIISPDNYDKWDEMVDTFVERRNGKASKEQAEKILKCLRIWGLQTEWSLERSIRLATLFAQHFRSSKQSLASVGQAER